MPPHSPLSYTLGLLANHSSLSSGAIAGIVIGGVVGLAILGLTWWYCFYRRRRNGRRLSTDLLDTSPTSMTSYSSRHDQMVVEPFTDNSPQPTTTNLSTTDLRAEEGYRPRKGDIASMNRQDMNRRSNDVGLRPQMGADSQGGSSSSRLVCGESHNDSLSKLILHRYTGLMRLMRGPCLPDTIRYVGVSYPKWASINDGGNLDCTFEDS